MQLWVWLDSKLCRGQCTGLVEDGNPVGGPWTRLGLGTWSLNITDHMFLWECTLCILEGFVCLYDIFLDYYLELNLNLPRDFSRRSCRSKKKFSLRYQEKGLSFLLLSEVSFVWDEKRCERQAPVRVAFLEACNCPRPEAEMGPGQHWLSCLAGAGGLSIKCNLSQRLDSAPHCLKVTLLRQVTQLLQASI